MELSNNGMKVLTFEELLALPNGNTVVNIHNGVESVFVIVGSLLGNVFICPYLNGKDNAIQINKNTIKGHVFLLIENNGIDTQVVKEVILAQLKEEYELKVEIVKNIYK